MTVKRLLPVICAPDMTPVRDFYTGLLGFKTALETDWFTRLDHADDPAIEVLIYRAGHSQVPERFCQGEGGALYLSLEVNNVDEIWKRAREAAADILKAPGHDDYDRRNLVLRDPAGTVLEIFTSGDPREAELSEYMLDA